MYIPWMLWMLNVEMWTITIHYRMVETGAQKLHILLRWLLLLYMLVWLYLVNWVSRCCSVCAVYGVRGGKGTDDCIINSNVECEGFWTLGYELSHVGWEWLKYLLCVSIPLLILHYIYYPYVPRFCLYLYHPFIPLCNFSHPSIMIFHTSWMVFMHVCDPGWNLVVYYSLS